MKKKTKQIKYEDFASLRKFVTESWLTNKTYFKIGDGMKVLAKMDNTIIGVS